MTTIPLLPLVILVTLGMAALFFVFLRARPKSPAITPDDSQWVSRFSVAKYRPMGRLLLNDDFEFLRRQRGYQPDIAKTLKAERRQIFRCYLRAIKRDFNRLHRIARFMVIYAPDAQPELVGALARYRWTFVKSYSMVQWRFALHVAAGAPVDVDPLVRALEAMRLQLNPAPAAV